MAIQSVYPDPIIKVNDTVRLDLETDKIIKHIKFEARAIALAVVQQNISNNSVKSANETQQSSTNVKVSKNAMKGRKKKNECEKALERNTWRTPPKQTEKLWLIQDPNAKYTSVTQQLVNYLLSTDVERLLRAFVIKRIELVIIEHFQNAEVIVFGSVNAELQIQTGRIIPDDENLGILLIELFELYGIGFNYKQLAIRVERDDNLGVDIGCYKKGNEFWATKCPEKLHVQDPV
ncbi:43051_t:CDS:2 [Gigaspora margarita]|uniref:43051_t:CDS:1 n=1 Tax=Gigaspora margarita TaxID=4874 RepID=A0ABN7UQ14_GIGMA|nr:43051_t:CDS:2 [Gigaspora margarita]